MGYTFDIKNVKNLRLYFNIDNLFVITKYKALDPELYGWVTTQNIDWGSNYFSPKIYSFGINVNF